jgi:hypothetical protein
MRLSKLRGKVRRETRRGLRNGTMTEYQAKLAYALCDDDDALAELNERVERDVNPWNRADGLVGAGFKEWLANLWDWFKENWPEILAIIMKLAPLLLILEPRDDEDR